MTGRWLAVILFAGLLAGCNPARLEDLVADLEGTWFGTTLAGRALTLEIAENGITQGNYDAYYFTGQAHLYGTRFELTSLDIDMEGTYIAESERLEGDLYDYRDPEETSEDRFFLRRVAD
ncbi:MAG TPA: hypothetical protein ENN88_00565 [Candidatus Coatesbacteria bacterium]|nr:hypothetical protein [Candidatus Coatesbacteria bacterium]